MAKYYTVGSNNCYNTGWSNLNTNTKQKQNQCWKVNLNTSGKNGTQLVILLYGYNTIWGNWERPFIFATKFHTILTMQLHNNQFGWQNILFAKKNANTVLFSILTLYICHHAIPCLTKFMT